MTTITHKDTHTVHAVIGDMSEDDRDEGDNYYLMTACGIFITGPIRKGVTRQRPPEKHCKSCWRRR